MARRRLTFGGYVRRRWRAVGAIVVLLLGALLLLGVTDRGHDPLWQATTQTLAQAAFAPAGDVAYALLREDGNITRIVAYRGGDGAVLWEGPLNATRAVLAAGPDGAAVATDFPRAFITVYGAAGSPEWLVPLEGNPLSMVIDGDHVALALNAPQNPVLVFEHNALLRTFYHASRVNALDMSAGLVATGTSDGSVIVRGLDGSERVNVSVEFGPRSLRLAQDGTSLVVGGGVTLADRGGQVAMIDIGVERPVRWTQETPGGVGLVDMDAAGLLALAVEEAPPRAVLHVYDGATGATRWTRLLEGSVAHDAGAQGGASLSPDARRVAVGTVRDEVKLYDATSGAQLWSYRGGGATTVAFAEDDARRLLVSGRLLANRPTDTLFVFSATGEPALQSVALAAATLVALAAAGLALYVGVGFWRAKTSYRA